VAKVLITEEISEKAIELLSNRGHDPVIKLSLDKNELVKEIKDAQGLIIRSATKVDAEVLSAAKNLVVVGRAGIGLDNVDVQEATKRGVMVVNAPQSNIVSAAEHTIALMLAMARNIAIAHNSLLEGKWERSKFEGVELFGKTLGIVGLGRVGALVAQRANSFGMRLIAYDPFVSKDRAKLMGVELKSLKELVSEADFLTVHLPKTPETIGLVNKELLENAKDGIRIINTARGGIIDEEALYQGLISGKVAAAALDVFQSEPPKDSPLIGLKNVTVTPHLGASTQEAQDKAGITIAEQVLLALEGEFVPYAVNVNAAEASEEAKKFLHLSEQLGKIFSGLCETVPNTIEILYEGNIAKEDTRILTLSILKGLLSFATEDPVSYVNAPQLAKERGLNLVESRSEDSKDYVNLIAVRSENHSLAGTLAGAKNEPRIVLVDDHILEVPPAPNMLVIRNDDRPGMIGIVGQVLGENSISISSMAVGPSKSSNTALMILSTENRVYDEIITRLKDSEGILEVHRVNSD
jgi:D-3-phosphoglycerate dehydrogenase